MPDQVTHRSVRAFGDRRNNAQLMAECGQLGYLDGRVLDLTYGQGRFWSIYRPDALVTNDLDDRTDADHHVDFCATGFVAASFDSVVLDPPYKLNGTSHGTGPAWSDESYGVGGPYRSVEDKLRVILGGVDEAVRLARRHVLVKVMDQVVSGKVRWMTDEVCAHVTSEHGGRKVDLMFVQGYRKQPTGRRQLHAHRDYSTLLVFKVPS